MALSRPYRFHGALLTLGVQTVEPDAVAAREMAQAAGLPLDRLPATGPIDDRACLGAMGFSPVTRLDLFPEEGPDVVADFTEPLPAGMEGGFDAVLDSGTTEHIYNLPRAVENLHRVLRPGGLVIHASPFCGWENHGFIQQSPKLWGRLWGLSGYRELQGWLVHIPQPGSPPSRRPWVAHIEDLDRPIACDSARFRTLLVVLARRTPEASLKAPVDTHTRQFMVPPESLRPVDAETERALRIQGLLPPAGQQGGGAEKPGRGTVISGLRAYFGGQRG